ncbi:MAG: BMP family ABC transporter substrate-binding protein [Firmicutes bacterium]|nr:BMP family ABC transporter substrate-binding protein [Bacillota bacterium]
MKKFMLVLLAVAMLFAFAACGQEEAPVNDPAENQEQEQEVSGEEEAAEEGITMENIKVGFMFIGSEADQGYSFAHIQGVKEMQSALGLADDQIICKYDIAEDSSCDTACRELVEAGCNIIFGNSFGFEDYMLEVAKEYPEVEFCHFTGYQAAGSGLDNFHNCFGHIYQARYLSGIVAGMLTESNTIGYVTAMPFAECISGYTAFYLGAKSVNPDVKMNVSYTNSWSDATMEGQVAQALIDSGCDVLGMHADTTAAMSTCAANGVKGVGYNADMTLAVPEACAASVVWDWAPCYIAMVEAVVNGEEMPLDWAGNLEDGMVDLTINDALVSQEIKDAVAAAKEAIIKGETKVFDTTTFTVEGAELTDDDASGLVFDGAFNESFNVSAPAFSYIVDGVTVLE